MWLIVRNDFIRFVDGVPIPQTPKTLEGALFPRARALKKCRSSFGSVVSDGQRGDKQASTALRAPVRLPARFSGFRVLESRVLRCNNGIAVPVHLFFRPARRCNCSAVCHCALVLEQGWRSEARKRAEASGWMVWPAPIASPPCASLASVQPGGGLEERNLLPLLSAAPATAPRSLVVVNCYD